MIQYVSIKAVIVTFGVMNKETKNEKNCSAYNIYDNGLYFIIVRIFK